MICRSYGSMRSEVVVVLVILSNICVDRKEPHISWCNIIVATFVVILPRKIEYKKTEPSP